MGDMASVELTESFKKLRNSVCGWFEFFPINKIILFQQSEQFKIIEEAKSEADKILTELELDEYAVLTPNW